MSDTTTDPEPDDEETARRKFDEALLNKHLTQLIEHFEAVRIFVTRPCINDPQQTAGTSQGRGNWYAQKGIVDEWVLRQQADTQRDVFNHGDDDSE